MSVKARIRSNWLEGDLPRQVPVYRIRPRSFAVSVFLHSSVVLALGLIPPQGSVSTRPIYDDVIRPDEHKIVWYDYRKPDLPDVDAAQRIGTFPKPRGKELSRDVIIATAPKATSNKQFIWIPVPKIEIKQDIAVPNLIARVATASPAPPPPEPKKPEKPQVVAPPTPQPNLSPPQPKGDVNRAEEHPVQPVEIPKPRKAFVPPPPAKQEARLTIPVQTADVPMPDASIVGTSSARNALPEGIGTPAFSKGIAPPPNAPPGPVTTAGNAKVDIAIAGLYPADKLNGPLPNGARPGEFSKAPIVGETATGEVKGGLSVPDLSIREDRTKVEPPRVEPVRKTVLYAEKIRTIPVTTLSVPLRPASRTIPRQIDARFQGRLVYTMVVPIENLPDYSGDWILWFAEQQPKPGDSPLMRAPIPLRKLELVETLVPGARTEFRILLAAIIRKDGKIDGISLLRNTGPAFAQAVIQDLASWEFKPAMRDGIPVDVDVILEIPFSFSSEIAKRAAP
jgi:TonB-like protein